jgi:outer membrane lipoprotein SlyB
MRRILLGITLLAAAAVITPPFASALQNPADGPGERIHGTVQSVNGTNAVIRADDGRTIRVDMSELPGKTTRGVKSGDRVVVSGVVDSANRVKARSLRDDSPGGAASADKDQWQRVHGRVQSVEGSKLKFRADDGRTLNVDMSAVGPEIQRALTPNERVTVIGFPGGKPNQFRAEYIQQDSSDASRQPSASPRR